MERKDRIRVQIAGQEFSVVGGGFQEMLAAVKQIAGRRFMSETKVWYLPGTVEAVERQLDISGYRLEGGRPLVAEEATPAAGAGQPAGDRIRIVVDGHRLAVVGGDFQEMLALVKSLPGRRFDRETRLWEVSAEVGVIKGMVEAAGFQLEGAEQIEIGSVPDMESLDFINQAPPPPPFEAPDFDEDIFAGPEGWDDELVPPVFDYGGSSLDEPVPFDPALVPPADEPARPAPAAGRSGGDRIRVRLGQVSLVVTGGSFQQMLAAVKGIPGRRFNGQDKVWEFPNDLSLEKLQQVIEAAGFMLRAE